MNLTCFNSTMETTREIFYDGWRPLRKPSKEKSTTQFLANVGAGLQNFTDVGDKENFMATEAIYIEQVTIAGAGRTFSPIEKLMLRRFHPRSIILDSVAMIWFTYLFWSHEWLPALLLVLITRTLSFVFVGSLNYSRVANSTWGKLAILHTHPANLVVQTVGAVLLLYGLWNHDVLQILSGISIILVGHWFGWSQVCEEWET